MESRLKQVLITLLLTLTTAAVAGADEADSGTAQLTLDDLRTFTDVFEQVRANYVDEIGDKALLNAAIRGMVSELDPYSAFHEAEEFKVIDDSSRGRYGGIGISVDFHEQRVRVVEVTEGGPAHQAGVQVGDLITAVDGKPVRGRALVDSTTDIRGEPGTEVVVRFRTGDEPARDLALLRQYIAVPSVVAEMVENRFAWFRISHFHEDSHGDFARASAKLGISRENAVAGVILDLRDNPGGVLHPAVELADEFLTGGLIVYTRGRYRATQLEFNANEGEWLPGVPVAVLVNGRSASASEVLAGALQDHERATVFGEPTFGKGSVQSVIALRNGAALRLTTARYYTPSGKSIQDSGIIPDFAVDSEQSEAALERALEWLRERAAE